MSNVAPQKKPKSMISEVHENSIALIDKLADARRATPGGRCNEFNATSSVPGASSVFTRVKDTDAQQIVLKNFLRVSTDVVALNRTSCQGTKAGIWLLAPPEYSIQDHSRRAKPPREAVAQAGP